MLTDKIKWIYLCMLGGLFEFGPKHGVWTEALVAEKIHEQSLRTILFGTHRPGGPDDTLMPPGISLQFKGYGWHQDESRMILVTREPRMYRIPEDPRFALRTTWLRISIGWVQFEDRIQWAKQSPRTPKFVEWGDRGVFAFEQMSKSYPKEPVKSTPAVAKLLVAKQHEWDTLWDEVHKSKGKLNVSSGHRVGWLHDVIQTNPFCDLSYFRA